MKQIKQINSVRGIGVLIVIAFHWLFSNDVHFISKPPLGVDIFFVLSGFFITGILLDGRDKAQTAGIKKANVFKFFIINRALRIFPIYYLTILFVALVPHSSREIIRNDLVYYLTYTANFNIYNTHYWDAILCHVWSLAVEEQFYLIWPFVMLFTNKRFLPHAICIFMFVGYVAQFWATSEFDIVLPFQCFDALGLGAILCWINMYKNDYLKKALNVLALLIGFCTLYYFVGSWIGRVTFFPDNTPSLVAGWFITYILLIEQKGEEKKLFLLNNRFLMFLGRISYGLYLYHLVVPYFSAHFLKRLQAYYPLKAALGARYFYYGLSALNFLLLLAIAWLSWKYIEKPILGLRKYLQKKPQQAPAVSEVSLLASSPAVVPINKA